MKKRHLGVLLTVLLSVAMLAVPLPSYAENDDLVTLTVDVSEMLYQEGGFGFVPAGEQEAVGDESVIIEEYFPGFLSAEPDIEGAKAAILEGLRGFQETISLAEYGIPRDTFKAMYVQLINDNPDLFYVTGGYSMSYNGSGIVVTLRPGYKNNVEIEQVQRYEAKVQEILRECIYPGMSEEEKALSLHDYLVAHCVYDLTYSNYDAYSALVEGQAVCQGYALGYQALLSRAGIDAQTISSNSMNHAWNQVKIDGDWYHVDATWDDPVRSGSSFSDASPLHPATGFVGWSRHNYFLLSDTAIQDGNHNHYGWNSELECTNTKYDSDVYWITLDTQVVFVNGNKYYLYKGSNYIELIENDTAILWRESCRWPVVGSANSHWIGCFTGFSYEDGVLYYNTSNEVKGYHLATGTVESVYTHEDTNSNLYGSFVDNGVLTMLASEYPSPYQTSDRVSQVSLKQEEPATPLTITAQPAAATVKDGSQATFTVVATGDGLTYQWELCYAGDSTFRKCTFPGANTASLTVDATKARNGYSFRCIVTDERGQSITSEAAKLTVKAEEALGVSLTASQSTADPGDIVTFTAVGNGGDGNYQYKFIINDTTNDKWYKLQDYSSNNTIQWTATTAGTKRIMVDIKDGTGKTVGKNVAVVVNGVPELSAKFTASSYEVNPGDVVTLTAEALGGSGRYNYKFIINDKTDDKWYRLQDFGTNNVITWTATTPGTKRLMVDVVDSDGRKYGTNITITVKEAEQ